MNKPSKRIPIADAKRIAEAHGQRQVIIVTWDGKNTHVVTYGQSVDDCKQAAEGGNKLKRFLGWPEELCQARPARAKSLRERIKTQEPITLGGRNGT